MYSKADKIIIWLSSFDFMSSKKIKSIIDNYNIVDFYDNLLLHKPFLEKILDSDQVSDMFLNNNMVYVDRVISNYNELNIKMITITSSDYPETLLNISDPPTILYCKGDTTLLKTDCLAVVGTRRATRYGKDVTEKIVKDLAINNITIISGLAEGIDTIAHKTCLDVNGKTIAVLGGGFNKIYPASNEKLAQDIVDKGGLIISEYKPAEPSVSYHFPVRNRIIAGLSKAVLISEATEKSGSIHTMNYALEFGREVFALPARINDIYSVACNKAIQSGHARMLLSSKDIMEVFGKSFTQNQNINTLQLTLEEQMIYDLLKGQEMSIDEIIASTNMEIKILTPLLLRMTMKKIINKLPSNYYSIAIQGDL